MRRIAALFCLLLAEAAAATPAPVAETPAPIAEQAENVVEIRFAPPLGQPMRYRLRRQQTDRGRTVVTEVVNEIRFEQREAGFRMLVTQIEARMPGAPPGIARLYEQIAAEFSRPFALRLSAAGEIEGLENDEAYWAEMTRLAELLIRRTEATRGGTDEQSLAFVRGMMGDTSAEGRLNTLTQYVSPIIEFASTSFVPGERRTGALSSAGMMGMTVERDIAVVAGAVLDGHLPIVVESSVRPEQLGRAVEGLMSRIPVTGRGENTEAGRARGMAAMQAMRLSERSESRYEVALDTGLARSVRATQRIEAESGGERRLREIVLEITLIR